MDELEIPDFLDRRKRPDAVGNNAARPETRLDQTTQPRANGELGNDVNSQKAILTGPGVAEKTPNEETSLPHAICESRQAACGEGSIRSETSRRSNKHDSSTTAATDEPKAVGDPLEGLVGRTATSPDAPFEPKTLARNTALKKDDSTRGGRSPTQTNVLIGLAQIESELFHAADGTGFADLDITVIAKPGRSAPRASAFG